MKFFVCIKQVPDISAAADVGRLVLNAYDASALEQALVLTEQQGGEVEVVLVGPDSAGETIRKALAMGAAAATHILVDAELDSHGVSRILADFFASTHFDVIACGKQSQDTDAGLTGGMLAERLGIPYASNAVGLDVSETDLTVLRQGDAGVETIELPMPCLVTCSNDMNDPRIPTLRGIIQAKKKSIAILRAGVEPVCSTRVDGYEALPVRPPGTIIGGGPGEMAATLVEMLSSETSVIGAD